MDATTRTRTIEETEGIMSKNLRRESVMLSCRNVNVVGRENKVGLRWNAGQYSFIPKQYVACSPTSALTVKRK